MRRARWIFLRGSVFWRELKYLSGEGTWRDMDPKLKSWLVIQSLMIIGNRVLINMLRLFVK
jgi:hypothetical protein